MSEMQGLILGIDTGGTYTDAVIYQDTEGKGRVLSRAKSPTVHEKLEEGIQNTLGLLDQELLEKVERVCLSTTLATNACVEGRGGEAALVLMGADEAIVAQRRREFALPEMEKMIFVPGKIHLDGSISQRPSREELVAALSPVCRKGVCVAVSGMLSVRNPQLEKEAAQVIEELGAQAVCSYQLAPEELNYLKRASTALLNARLIPLITQFLEAVDFCLKERNIQAPVFIVRSDGSLMSREFARVHPVQTLLCGPSASVSGALRLSEMAGESLENAIIADIGGTTTDIALLEKGRIVESREGVRIGEWQTTVAAAKIETLGLGGDTHVTFDREGRLQLENTRAIPLCMLSERLGRDRVRRALEAMENYPYHGYRYVYDFLVLERMPDERDGYNPMEMSICRSLAQGPLTCLETAEKVGADLYGINVQRLEKNGIIRRASFTLTDAMHILGLYTAYDREASLLGAAYFTRFLKISAEEMARQVWEMAVYRLYRAVLLCGLSAHEKLPLSEGVESLIRRSFEDREVFAFLNLGLKARLVGVGAPAHWLVKEAARRLGTQAFLPEDAAVANAVGAASCSVRATVRLPIRAKYESEGLFYQLLTENGVLVVGSFEEAVEKAREEAARQVTELARARGLLGELEISFGENHNVSQARTDAGVLPIDLGGEVTATAEVKR